MTEQHLEAEARDAWGRVKATRPSPEDIITTKAPEQEQSHLARVHTEDLDLDRNTTITR